MIEEISFISNKNSSIRFCVKCIHVKLAELKNGSPVIKQHAVISLKNVTNNKFIVHPLTSFIFSNWKYQAYNTQRLHANNVVSFLNYLLLNQTLKINSLSNLTFEHATSFLNYMSRSNKSRSTVKGLQRTLTFFYEYLAKKELLIGINRDEFHQKSNPQYPLNTYTSSPFRGVILPSRNIPNQAHMLPEEYIIPFIETAVRIANPIALGVYLQCFGGIRVGGLVNISRDDITSIGAYGAHGMIIKLRKKQMRHDVTDLEGSSYVKKPRRQMIFPIKNWLQILYKEHLQNYSPLDNSNALFVTSKGKAMTGSLYRYYFSKVKTEFLFRLRQSENPVDRVNASKLEEFKWSTHIGRGIFTNLLAEEALNAYDIALPRGDSNLSSSLVYQGNTIRMKEKLEARLDDLYKNYVPNFYKNGGEL